MQTRRSLVLLLMLLVVAVGLGVAVALATPPGQPYDEPAHHANAVFYAQQHRLPILGEPGAYYEAQMGPVYYVAVGAVLVLTGTIDDPTAGLTVLRLGGLLLIPILGMATFHLARRLGARPLSSALAGGLVTLNPSMVAIGSSVQNDYLCVTLTSLAALVGMRALSPDADLCWAIGAGALIGLAVLIKVFAGALLVGFVVAALVDRHAHVRIRLGRSGAAIAALTSVSGWWFVRNLVLYGDLTGAAGVAGAGATFPPLEFQGLSSLLGWGRSLISYGFAPTEYYRNAFDAPTAVEGLAAVLTVLLVGFVAVRLVRRRRAVGAALGDEASVVLALVTVVVMVVTYAIAAWAVQAIAPRLMFVVAPLALGLLARAARGCAGSTLLVATLVGFMLIDVWLVFVVGGVVPNPILFPL